MKTRHFALMGAALAMTSAANAQTAPAPCLDDQERNTLDFTLGDWEIIVNGEAVAWITLEKDGQNCLIRERYGVPVNGQEGAGIDYWDPHANIWRRILVTSVGTVESFEGFQADEKFIWNGREQRIDGSTVLERVEMWREGDTMRNDIYQSTDGGVTWVLRGSETRTPRRQ